MTGTFHRYGKLLFMRILKRIIEDSRKKTE
jgi:hypothetical protein